MVRVVRDDSGKRRINAIIRVINKMELKVGWFKDATYPNGTSIAYVASIQEFGTKDTANIKIPERPFLRPTITEKLSEWRSDTRIQLRKVFLGKLKYRQYLDSMGIKMQEDIKESIKKVHSPELAESTIRSREYKRGISREGKGVNTKTFTKPLVDTGQMIGSLTYKILSNYKSKKKKK